MKMTITREKAIKLFELLGYKTAGKWSDAKILEKIGKLAELTANTKVKSAKAKTLINALISAGEVDITSAKTKSKPKEDDENDDDGIVGTVTYVKGVDETEADDMEEVNTTKKSKKSKKSKKAKAEKPAKAKKTKEEKPAKVKKEKTEKSVKVKKTTRLKLVVLAIMKAKKGASISEMAKEVNDTFVASGGISHIPSTKKTIKICLGILDTAGTLDKTIFNK
jgi:hypothetical protein